MYKLVMGIRIDSLIGIQNKYPFSGIFKYILTIRIFDMQKWFCNARYTY